MTHASCLLGTTWSSKLGEDFRISHPRVGLVGGILYGDIVSHYCPATTLWSLPKDLELEPASQEVVQQIATLADSIKTSYPELTNNFDTLYAAWKGTWFSTFNMALQQRYSLLCSPLSIFLPTQLFSQLCCPGNWTTVGGCSRFRTDCSTSSCCKTDNWR